MPPKITNFIPGSCFGYYDKLQKNCKKCKYNIGCKNATLSQQVDKIRKIFKTKNSIIEQLNNKYK